MLGTGVVFLLTARHAGRWTQRYHNGRHAAADVPGRNHLASVFPGTLSKRPGPCQGFMIVATTMLQRSHSSGVRTRTWVQNRSCVKKREICSCETSRRPRPAHEIRNA